MMKEKESLPEGWESLSYRTKMEAVKIMAWYAFLKQKDRSRYSTAGNHQASLRYLKKLQKESVKILLGDAVAAKRRYKI